MWAADVSRDNSLAQAVQAWEDQVGNVWITLAAALGQADVQWVTAEGAPWQTAVAGEADAIVAWTSAVADAEAEYKNAVGDAELDWVADQASAYVQWIRDEAAASRQWDIAEADAEWDWQYAVGAAALYRWADGASVGDALLGGLADASGVNDAYASITNHDLVSGQALHMTPEQRASMGGSAAANVLGTFVGARAPRHLCFVAGTNIFVVEQAAQATLVASTGPASDAAPFDFGDIEECLEDWRSQAALACLGVAAVATIARRSQTKRVPAIEDAFPIDESLQFIWGVWTEDTLENDKTVYRPMRAA